MRLRPARSRRPAALIAAAGLFAGLAAPLAASAQTGTSAGPAAAVLADVRAVRVAAAPKLDGRLDDAAWANAPAVEGFRQIQPRNGAASAQRTVVRIVYDDAAVYVGARMYDSAPDSIAAQLGRRDNAGNSDTFVAFFDSFHDRRSGYFFGVNSAGTVLDGTLSNDGNRDDSWDGVWEGKAARDGEGWTAELRIPYSQLRFARGDVQLWGVNFGRFIPRHGEESYLRVPPASENAFVSYFADLRGIERVRPGRGLEILPYVTARADFADAPVGDPFRDGSRMRAEAGADVKFAVTPNLTLSATVNPDFGQVEVDPAEVNLSGFETFFSERRPFFVEGSSNYDFGSGGSSRNVGFNWVNNDLFYSRRIGRQPQGSLPDGLFEDIPETSRILGAAKLTGRVAGTNVGILSSVTNREMGRYATGPQGGPLTVERAEVEPLSHYGVVRALREFAGGKQGLGFMGTAVNRAFGREELRASINGQAYAGGLDAWTQFGGGRFVLKGFLAASTISGTATQIARVQRSSVHYLQRPDRTALRYDPSRTTLSGYMTRISVDKIKGDGFFNAAFGAVSPGYDINDLGFLGRGDVLNAHVMVGQNYPNPSGIFQRRWMGAAAFAAGNFDGDRTGTGLWARTENTFRNFWSLNANAMLSPSTYSPTLTRGGPVAENLGGLNFNVSPETDSRKTWGMDADLGGNLGKGSQSRYGYLGVRWQPGSNLRISLGPNISHSTNRAQYVRRVDDATAALDAPVGASAAKARYVFAHLDQWEVGSDVRVNWTFSPAMSLQLYAQPLLSTGDYTRFGELARARSFEFTRYAESGSVTPVTDTKGAVTGYAIDPDGAGAAPAFSVGNPDFRFVSLRGNAVFRWEYRPGSALFFVWTTQAQDQENLGGLEFARPVRRLFDRRPDNVFAVKATYWIGR